MQYYSTNKQAPDVTLEEAVVKGLAADKGLFMPFTIKPLPQEFYDTVKNGDIISVNADEGFVEIQ
jgi:threonine synthase